MRADLPPPPRYFPPARGRYTTTPDLHRLDVDFGNGALDHCLFQFDAAFDAFRREKLAARAARFERCVLAQDFDPPVAAAVCRLIRDRLVAESPDHFAREGSTLTCRLTGERLVFDEAMGLIGADSTAVPSYRDAFDALCCQAPEDIAVVRRTASGDANVALHVCLPSRWAPEEKIGKSYVATHAPVPGMDRNLKAAPALVDLIVARGPFVRFTWGLAFTPRLDLHPQTPNPSFNGTDLWLRVERQTLWPLPAVDAALFAIRLHVYPTAILDTSERALLRAALISMPEESRLYKGISDHVDAILKFLV